jgi:MscS family membrane protein
LSDQPEGSLSIPTKPDTLENLSLRDRFWFHHILRLRHETTTSQLRSILDGVTRLLEGHPSSIREPVRVRFQCFGVSSFEVEIFSYLAARDWDEFLRLQEELLLQIREVVHNAKAQPAIPAQTTYLIVSSGADSSSVPMSFQHSRDAA